MSSNEKYYAIVSGYDIENEKPINFEVLTDWNHVKKLVTGISKAKYGIVASYRVFEREKDAVLFLEEQRRLQDEDTNLTSTLNKNDIDKLVISKENVKEDKGKIEKIQVDLSKDENVNAVKNENKSEKTEIDRDINVTDTIKDALLDLDFNDELKILFTYILDERTNYISYGCIIFINDVLIEKLVFIEKPISPNLIDIKFFYLNKVLLKLLELITIAKDSDYDYFKYIKSVCFYHPIKEINIWDDEVIKNEYYVELQENFELFFNELTDNVRLEDEIPATLEFFYFLTSLANLLEQKFNLFFANS